MKAIKFKKIYLAIALLASSTWTPKVVAATSSSQDTQKLIEIYQQSLQRDRKYISQLDPDFYSSDRADRLRMDAKATREQQVITLLQAKLNDEIVSTQSARLFSTAVWANQVLLNPLYADCPYCQSVTAEHVLAPSFCYLPQIQDTIQGKTLNFPTIDQNSIVKKGELDLIPEKNANEIFSWLLTQEGTWESGSQSWSNLSLTNHYFFANLTLFYRQQVFQLIPETVKHQLSLWSNSCYDEVHDLSQLDYSIDPYASRWRSLCLLDPLEKILQLISPQVVQQFLLSSDLGDVGEMTATYCRYLQQNPETAMLSNEEVELPYPPGNQIEQEIKLMVEALRPAIISLESPIYLFHWAERDQIYGISETGPIRSQDAHIKMAIEGRITSASIPPLWASGDLAGPGMYFALDPHATRSFGGAYPLLVVFKAPAGTNFFSTEIYDSHQRKTTSRDSVFSCTKGWSNAIIRPRSEICRYVTSQAFRRLELAGTNYPYISTDYTNCKGNEKKSGTAFVLSDPSQLAHMPYFIFYQSHYSTMSTDMLPGEDGPSLFSLINNTVFNYDDDVRREKHATAPPELHDWMKRNLYHCGP